MIIFFLFINELLTLTALERINLQPETWPETDENGFCQSFQNNGVWVNWWLRNKPSLMSIGASFLFTKDESGIDKENLDQLLPVEQPYWLRTGLVRKVGLPGVRATWIGHSTVLAEVDGALFLCDPIFSERASMSQWFGPKRYRPPACSVSQLPDHLDGVVISHTHYDHMDYNSIMDLHKRYPSMRWFVPAGVKSWFSSVGIPETQVNEMKWWDEVELEHNRSNAKVVFTPSNHWSRRTATDENKSLWGSWTVVGSQGSTFWFGGDTAYCEAFKQIGEKFGPFSLAAIPIGAYEPRSTMKFVHVNPEEAIQIHKDLKSAKSLGIHWGTFKLTYEHFMEPKKKILELVQSGGKNLIDFQVVNIGETIEA